jgi:hypothetical protein
MEDGRTGIDQACHGPGATYIALGGDKAYIDKVYAAALCRYFDTAQVFMTEATPLSVSTDDGVMR